MTLSSAYAFYATLPHSNTAEYLHRAIIASQEALTRLDESQQPSRYAQALMNHANTLCELSTCIDTDQQAHIRNALDDYQESLTYRTETLAPDDYAWTQHNYADITDEPTMEHFRAAWIAIHEALRLRPRHADWWNHAHTHYVRTHIAMEYAEALYKIDETQAHDIIKSGLESYHAIKALGTEISIPMNMLLGITDYASMLYGLHAWVNPESATTSIQMALKLNNDARAQYPPDAHDDQAEVLAHRIQILHWAWMLGHTTTDIVPDVRAAERLCDMPLRPIIACQLHMRLAIMGYDITLAEHSRGPGYHADRAKHLAQRLSYAPVARALA